MFTRLRGAVKAAAVCGLAIGTVQGLGPPARAQESADVVVNCVAWDDAGDNIGDNLFYVDEVTPAQSSVMPIGQAEIVCTNLPSSLDAVRVTPGPGTSLGGAGALVELSPGQTASLHPTAGNPGDDVVLTVTRIAPVT